MARLSGYLSGQLANPSYGGMLSQNVQGGMQGIADTMAAKRQRNATDSMLTMLTKFNPNDPKVLDSVKAVGRQTGQDPLAVEKLIQDQQLQERIRQATEDQKKQMAMAVERQKWAEANQKWDVSRREKLVGQENAALAAITAHNKNPGGINDFISTLPPEFQPAAMEAVANKVQYQTTMTQAAEEAQMADGLSKDTLDTIAGIGEYGKQLVKMYEGTKGEGKRAAAARILGLYEEYVSNKGFLESGRGADAAGKPAKPAEWEAVAVQAIIDDMFGIMTDTPDAAESSKINDKTVPSRVAWDAAQMKAANPQWAITKEWVKQQSDKYVQADEGKQDQAADPNAPPVKKDYVPTEQEIKEMMEGNPGYSREEIIAHLKQIEASK